MPQRATAQKQNQKVVHTQPHHSPLQNACAAAALSPLSSASPQTKPGDDAAPASFYHICSASAGVCFVPVGEKNVIESDVIRRARHVSAIVCCPPLQTQQNTCMAAVQRSCYS
jgi:hypothetical protein